MVMADDSRNTIYGIPVLGPIEAAARMIRTTTADEAIIAIPSATREQLAKIYAILRRANFARIRNLGHNADAGEIGPSEDGVDLGELLARCAGNRDDGLVGGRCPDHAGGSLYGPQHGDAVDEPAD